MDNDANAQHRPEPPLGRAGKLYLLVVGLMLALAYGSGYAAAPEEARAGTLFFGQPGTLTLATRLDTEVDMQVSGLMARVTLAQRFRNDGPDWVEGTYVFPLPDNAAVDRLRLIIGERVIEGEIQERAAARANYVVARESGKKASLVEQQRPNLFTTAVANIGPGEEVRVEIGYLQTLRYDQGEFRLRFPMTATPRYVPGAPLPSEQAGEALRTGSGGWARPTDQVPDADRVTPPINHPNAPPVNPHRLRVRLTPGFELQRLDSLHHPAQQRREGEDYQLSISAPRGDRDFELVWAPIASEAPVAAVFAEELAGEHYALLMLLPPTAASAERLPRELIFVIDTSGSMGGASIEQARQALQLALQRLTPADRFNLIEFNSDVRALFAEPVAADATAVNLALRYAAALQASGGTEMAPALRAALAGTAPASYLRQVVFITDGAVANEDALFGQIAASLGEARLFTVGIGSAPNSHFMRKAAEHGRGSYTYISDAAQVGERMQGLFGKLEQPVLRDLCLHWPGAAEAYPSRLPDLYAGEPLLISARLPALAGTVELCGVSADRAWSRKLGLDGAAGHAGVATVWARSKIETLLDSRHAGADPDAVRAEVTALALKHQLVSPYTSLVAIDRTPSRPAQAPLSREALPQQLPAGSDPRGFGLPMPQTALGLPWQLSLGLGSLLLAGMIRVLGGRGRPS